MVKKKLSNVHVTDAPINRKKITIKNTLMKSKRKIIKKKQNNRNF